jgi:hypothetical protein
MEGGPGGLPPQGLRDRRLIEAPGRRRDVAGRASAFGRRPSRLLRHDGTEALRPPGSMQRVRDEFWPRPARRSSGLAHRMARGVRARTRYVGLVRLRIYRR